MESNQALLAIAETLLQQKIAPFAAVIDNDPEALRSALQELGNASLLGLRIPQHWGGAEVDGITFRFFQEIVARCSGALAFLQAQHQSAGSLLARSENEALKQQYLPYMNSGQALVGISFAHLRRTPSPIKAIAVPGGYQLNGQAPWVTGAGCFQTFIVAAVLPNEQVVYGMVPFQSTRQETGGAIVCSDPMQLAAMTSTGTVTVEFQDWLLSAAQVVQVEPLAAIAKSDRLNVLHHSFFALGCARAGLDILERTYQQKQLGFIQTACEALAQELAACRQAIFTATTEGNHSPSNLFATNLQLRAWAIELAVRCAHAAIAASSGAANSNQHPAQRIYREALVYTVSGQTAAVMEATLARLTFSTRLTQI
ncbi:acyl-CoA/acyl-ACP dehydrogenase [Kovacikia minuta CCNUW1]|uniref:acyl-CoA dehydrogenase family protein n=1 Tax=Kovacikia minuta TaxID=2931930 RepID=UPI001CC976A4|nr:acyl-CoA dehydrogenase family protein [Kovacikia minuta]UBF24617.1 acyl-CoA/acyl-ACP dehydrogenase [Kovacikia minuta CCNUW1]